MNEKKSLTQKQAITLAITLAVVGILAAVLVLALAIIPKQECQHIDADSNYVCDKCNANLTRPIQPDEDPDGGDDNKPDEVIDYTKDLDNAAELFNKLMTGNLALDFDNACLTDFVYSGTMLDGMTEKPDYVEIDGDKMYMESKNDLDEVFYTYTWTVDDGVYTVVFDGANYEGSWEPIVKETPPEIYATDLVYDESSGYFIVSQDCVTSVKDALLGQMSNTGDNELIDLDTILAELTYDVRFKVTETNEICDLKFKGVSVVDEISNDVISMTYSKNNNESNMTVIVNYYILMKFDIVVTNNGPEGTLSVSGYIKPPMGVEMENMDMNISADILYNLADIEFEIDVLRAMEEAKSNYGQPGLDPDVSLDEILDEKYADGFVYDNNECDAVVIYDEDYEVYVRFTPWYFDSSYVYRYEDYSNEPLPSDCYASIIDGNMVIYEHSADDSLDTLLTNKYEDGFESLGCDEVVIYDAQYEVYVKFNRWSVNGSGWYVYTSYEHDLADFDTTLREFCVARLEGDRLVAETHCMNCGLANKYTGKYQISLLDVYCEEIAVWDAEYQLWAIFEEDIREEEIYVYKEYTTQPSTRACVAVIMEQQYLHISTHTEFCFFMHNIHDVEFTLVGYPNNDLNAVYVYNETVDHTFIFYDWDDNGTYIYGGWVSGLSNDELGTIDLNAKTITKEVK